MSLACLDSATFAGLEALVVRVEVDLTFLKEDKGFLLNIVGLPDVAVRESKDRVLSAIKNSGSTRPPDCIATINLAPGSLKKEGPLYDLPIALGLLAAMGKIPPKHLEEYLCAGELGLGGECRHIAGALAIAMLARERGKKGVILPACNAGEAAAVPGIHVYGVQTLAEAVQFLTDPTKKNPAASMTTPEVTLQVPDFSEIKGHFFVKRAMEIAAAGNHNVLLSGAPGCGKTMLAKALIGVMPELTVEEKLEVTRIHSVAGLLPAGMGSVQQRPFRAPHHTVSYAGLIGGGTNPRPGEVSLAHRGILFLDEFPEFSRQSLEVLRQPLEDGKVTISRAKARHTYPSEFLCIAAMNPCPCGYLGHISRPCRCTELQVSRYSGKISGPLRDRFDMHIQVPSLRYQEMVGGEKGESSAVVRRRVQAAREIQRRRFGKCNSRLIGRELKSCVTLDASAAATIQHAIESMHISARAYDRILRVARTIADLGERDAVTEEDILEALNFRETIKI